MAGIISVTLTKGTSTKKVEVGSTAYKKYIAQGYTESGGTTPTTSTATTPTSSSGSMGSYKGVNIPAGSTDAQIQAIIKSVDAGTATPTPTPTPAPTPTTTKPPTGTVASYNNVPAGSYFTMNGNWYVKTVTGFSLITDTKIINKFNTGITPYMSVTSSTPTPTPPTPTEPPTPTSSGSTSGSSSALTAAQQQLAALNAQLAAAQAAGLGPNDEIPGTAPSGTSGTTSSTAGNTVASYNNVPTGNYFTMNGKYYQKTGTGFNLVSSVPSGTSYYTVSTPTTTTPTPTPTTTTSTPTQTMTSAPTVALEPGATGPEVKKLQDFLVSQGFMTQAQVNTGYGTYGPQTTAAVLALQQKLGIDYSSGPGYFGPKTIAALSGNTSIGAGTGAGATPVNPNQPQIDALNTELAGVQNQLTEAKKIEQQAIDAGMTVDKTTTLEDMKAFLKNPPEVSPTIGIDTILSNYGIDSKIFSDPSATLSTYTDTWKTMYDDMGLGTIKQEVASISKEYEDLQNEKDLLINDINDNPWIDEGTRLKQINRVNNDYLDRENNLSGRIQVEQSLYEQGVAEAKFILGSAYTQFNADRSFAQDMLISSIEMAQKQKEAQADSTQQDFENELSIFNAETGRINATKPSDISLSLNKYLTLDQLQELADRGVVTDSNGNPLSVFTQVSEVGDIGSKTPTKEERLTAASMQVAGFSHTWLGWTVDGVKMNDDEVIAKLVKENGITFDEAKKIVDAAK